MYHNYFYTHPFTLIIPWNTHIINCYNYACSVLITVYSGYFRGVKYLLFNFRGQDADLHENVHVGMAYWNTGNEVK